MDYKRQAINAFLTETYCSGDENPKYSNKHRDLIEKALYSDKGWHKLRKQMLMVGDRRVEKLNTAIPFSIRKAVEELHQSFKDYLNVSDLEELTLVNIDKYDRESDDSQSSAHGKTVEINYGSLPSDEDMEGIDDLSDQISNVSMKELRKEMVKERAVSRHKRRKEQRAKEKKEKLKLSKNGRTESIEVSFKKANQLLTERMKAEKDSNIVYHEDDEF